MNIPSYERVYEDQYILAINKPIQIHSVPQLNKNNTSLLEKLGHVWPDILQPMNKANAIEGGALHRLDYETSGLILFAKNQEAYNAFVFLLQKGTVKKKYLAISNHVFNKKQATIETYFASRSRKSKRVYAVKQNDKQLYKRITNETYKTEIQVRQQNSRGTFIEAEISRGFRHQIRCHLQYVGLPILGDPIYNKEQEDRMYLHSHVLEFVHPITSQKMLLTAAYDHLFVEKIRQLQLEIK